MASGVGSAESIPWNDLFSIMVNKPKPCVSNIRLHFPGRFLSELVVFVRLLGNRSGMAQQ